MSNTVEFDNTSNEVEEIVDSFDDTKPDETEECLPKEAEECLPDEAEKCPDYTKDVNGSVGLKKLGMKNEPSKVVHIALIPPIVRDEDLSFIGLAFGDISMLLYIKKRRHAMICFERQEDAESMVSYFSKYSAQMFQSTLSIEYSNHKELSFGTMSRNVSNTQNILQKAKELKKVADDGIPGSVIRVVAKNQSTILTMESLYKTFCDFGIILKIVISKRSNSTESFIQLSDVESAQRAIAAFADKKSSKVEVSTAREQSLTVKFNNARSRDFTNPTLLASSDTESQTSVSLSAGIQLAEGADNDSVLMHLSRLVGMDLDRSMPFAIRDEKRRSNLSSSDFGIDDVLSAKRRRSERYMGDQNEAYEPFDDNWIPPEQRMSDAYGLSGASSSGGRHSSPPYGLPTKDDIIDQLLMLASRNPQHSNTAFIQSLASGRLDGNTILAAKQILAERAMTAIANDPYAKLLNSLISTNTGRAFEFPTGTDNFGRINDPQLLKRYANDDSYGYMREPVNFDMREERGGKVLFVSNLNAKEVNPDALFTLFGVYGDVQRVKLMFTKSGSALVQLNTVEQACQAISHLNGITIYGKRMRITFSKYSQVQVSKDPQEGEQWSKNYENSPLHRYRHPGSRNCKNIYPPSEFLHLSNICDDTSKEELQQIFEQYGKVINIRFFVTDRRMGVVEMNSISTACEALIGAHNHLLSGGRRLRISFANQRR